MPRTGIALSVFAVFGGRSGIGGLLALDDAENAAGDMSHPIAVAIITAVFMLLARDNALKFGPLKAK